MQKKHEGSQSEWLQSKTKTSKKWFWLGWTGAIVVVIAFVLFFFLLLFERPFLTVSFPSL
jgi:disulfide bond formation protein DsbB